MASGKNNLKEMRILVILTTFAVHLIVMGNEVGFAQHPLQQLGNTMRYAKRSVFDTRKPHATPDRCTAYVASEIDWLEHKIEQYGSITPKHANVWGEARLTQHRHEYERQLDELFTVGKAETSLQGAIRRSDQSFLALALSSEAASEGGEANASVDVFNTVGIGDDNPLGEVNNEKAESRLDLNNFKHEKISLEPVVYADQVSRYLKHLNQLRRINEGDDTTDAPGYSLNLVRIPVSILPGKHTRKGYGAEVSFTATPYLSDQLLPDTFYDLVINDLVDLLALPITKMIDCKDKRDQLKLIFKYGDEVTYTISHMQRLQQQSSTVGIGDERLAVELFAIDEAILNRTHQILTRDNEIIQQLLKSSEKADREKGTKLAEQIHEVRSQILGTQVALQRLEPAVIEKSFGQQAVGRVIQFEAQLNAKNGVGQPSDAASNSTAAFLRSRYGLDDIVKRMQSSSNSLRTLYGTVAGELVATLGEVRVPVRKRRSTLPFPSTQLRDVFGSSNYALGRVALDAVQTIGKEDEISLMDVRRFLLDELHAAYQFLQHDNGELLSQHCTDELATAIYARRRRLHSSFEHGFGRAGDPKSDLGLAHFDYRDATRFRQSRIETSILAGHRDRYFHDLKMNFPRMIYTTTATLSWAIIVESAVLNRRLMADMVEAAVSKGSEPPIQRGEWLDCYMPQPTAEASEAFRQYVLCRWPIQVFHLDPLNQDQNIADVFSQRRELQFAIAAAVATGNMSTSRAMRFARRLEKDAETIALNSTVVGFSHGADTFGWRFYPRFQTPDTPGAVGAFAENLFGRSSRDHDLADRSLEPGIRECTALVVMPSFVPYVTIESRGSWFRLRNPANIELTLEQSLELSRKYQAVRCQADGLCENGLYRPGDVSQLTSVLSRLEKRLPLQTMQVSVPHENTSGGFEMFSNGITDLAPELLGWYGGPGVVVSDETPCSCEANDDNGVKFYDGGQCNETCRGTTLFIVGDGFNINDTRVVAGGKCVPYVLISRQIMRVTIPPDVTSQNIMHCGEERDVIGLHVATPYGVTNQLYIKAIKTEKGNETKEQLQAVETAVKTVQQRLALSHAEISFPDDAEVPVKFFSNGQYFHVDTASIQATLKSTHVLSASRRVTLGVAFRQVGGAFAGPISDFMIFDLPGGVSETKFPISTIELARRIPIAVGAKLSTEKTKDYEAVFYIICDGCAPIPVTGGLPIPAIKIDCCPPTRPGFESPLLPADVEKTPPEAVYPLDENEQSTYDHGLKQSPSALLINGPRVQYRN